MPSVRERQPRVETGNFLYGGPLKVHFGHIMVDSIIRLWAFDPVRHDQVVFAKLQETRGITDWISEILSLFGVKQEHVRLVNGVAAFERMEFAEPGSRLASGPSAAHLDYLDGLPLSRTTGTPKKVYFGRTHMIAKGTILGESHWAAALESNGYTCVVPERMTIHEQTSVLRNAESVVFLEGSSIYSIELLSKIAAPVFMIPRRAATGHLFAPHIAPRTSFTVLGDPETIVRRLTAKGAGGPSSPSYSLNPEDLHDDMVAKGLIRGSFSMSAYREAERADAATYFASQPEIGEAQLADIEQVRAGQGARTISTR